MTKAGLIGGLIFFGFYAYSEVHLMVRTIYLPIDAYISTVEKRCKIHVSKENCEYSRYQLRDDVYGKESFKDAFFVQWLPVGTRLQKDKWSNEYYINDKKHTLSFSSSVDDILASLFFMSLVTGVYIITNRNKCNKPLH